MNATVLTCALCIAIVLFVATVYLGGARRLNGSDHVPAHAGRTRSSVSVEALFVRIRTEMQPPAITHVARPRYLTVPEAHREMLRHTDCDFRRCGRKAAAWDALQTAGVIRS